MSHPYRPSPNHARFVALCELDLALTYALRRPRLARQCLDIVIAVAGDQPDIAYRAREIGGCL